MTKRYTVGEANALLPYLAPTLVELRDKFEKAAAIKAATTHAAATNGGSHDRDSSNRVLARVQELLERLQEWDIELRDVSTGLVDFPSAEHGDDALLCWRLGEPEVGYWHTRDEGFPGRRPI